MNTFLLSAMFSFGMALPIGAGSCKMIQNGLNKAPIHAFLTGTGMNVIDICMFTLYYFGLSYIFEINAVQIFVYLVGIFVLGNLAYHCFNNNKINLQNNISTIHAKYSDSIKDGILIALVPSSIVYWTTIYGAFLSKYLATPKTFIIACGGILFGFFVNNWFYTLVAFTIKKFANHTIVKWVNIISGLILSGFATYFVYQLILILL